MFRATRALQAGPMFRATAVRRAGVIEQVKMGLQSSEKGSGKDAVLKKGAKRDPELYVRYRGHDLRS